jgi:hypothetical protein
LPGFAIYVLRNDQVEPARMPELGVKSFRLKIRARAALIWFLTCAGGVTNFRRAVDLFCC